MSEQKKPECAMVQPVYRTAVAARPEPKLPARKEVKKHGV
jgi:hypothetical protein